MQLQSEWLESRVSHRPDAIAPGPWLLGPAADKGASWRGTEGAAGWPAPAK